MTFNEWTRKRWYIFAILVGVGSAVSQLFISNRHPILIGFLIALGVGYVIYKIQSSEPQKDAQSVDETVDSSEKSTS